MEKQATLSKTQVAAHPQTQDAVPSYEHHTADDLYTERIQNYGTGLPDHEEDLTQTLDSSGELQLDPAPQDEDPVPPAFPSAPPSGPPLLDPRQSPHLPEYSPSNGSLLTELYSQHDGQLNHAFALCSWRCAGDRQEQQNHRQGSL